MFYRIAEVTLCSQIELPTYRAFVCEAGNADATLEIAEGSPPEGKETVSGRIAHRKTSEGWFFHAPWDDQSGVLASWDYTRLRLFRPKKGQGSGTEAWFVRVAMECLLIHRGYVPLHAACVELNGEAFAFCGFSGAGKSTRARAWENALGATLLSGDRPLVRVNGPEVFGVPWDGKECCYRNAHFPLRGIYEVRRSSADYARKMTFEQKRLLLLRNSFMPMWDTDTAAIEMMNIVRLASSGNILRVFCGPGEENAKALRQALDAHHELKEAHDMKAKSGFVLRNIVGEYVLMPTGENIGKFNGTVLLNQVSAFIWEKMQNPISRDDLLAAVLNEFQVDEATAAKDLDELLKKLEDYQVIEN